MRLQNDARARARNAVVVSGEGSLPVFITRLILLLMALFVVLMLVRMMRGTPKR
jgi:hypothetical protein